MNGRQRELLRILCVSGGMLALLLHLALPASPLGAVGLAALAVMYLSLPAFVWLRRRWDSLPAACAFALAFGYCVVDTVLQMALG